MLTEDELRAKFEAWMHERYPLEPTCVGRHPKGYNHFQVDFAWIAWQAAYRLATEPSPAKSPEIYDPNHPLNRMVEEFPIICIGMYNAAYKHLEGEVG